MPVRFSQAGHVFDAILSSKGIRIEYGGAEVFRYWPGDEYSANLPAIAMETPSTVGDVLDIAGVDLGPGTYRITVEGDGNITGLIEIPDA